MPSPLDQGRTLTESRVIEIVRQIIRTEIRKLALSAGAVDHGALAGLLDDDHPQYSLVSHPFVLIGNDVRLTGERALTAGDGLDLTDGGANSTVTLSVDLLVNGALGIVGGELSVRTDNISIFVNGSNQLEVDVGPGLQLSGAGVTVLFGAGINIDGSDQLVLYIDSLPSETVIDVVNDEIIFNDDSAAHPSPRRTTIANFFSAANAAGIGLSHPQVLARTLGA